MITVQKSLSVAANSSVSQVIAGSRLEYAPTDGFINLYTTGSALGLSVRMVVAGDEKIESSEVNAQNRLPQVPDDLLQADVMVLAGQRVQLEVTNSTAGALTLFYRVELQEDDFSDVV